MVAIAVWGSVLMVSIYLLIRGAGYFVDGARQVGTSLGMAPLAIGIVIMGFGTSIPELATAIAAVIHGATEVVVANTVGSNIVNILLVIGMLTAVGGKIVVQRELIKSELPIFFIATALFILAVYDGMLDRAEAVLLLGTFAAYLWYLFYEAGAVDKLKIMNPGPRPAFAWRALIGLLGGLTAVLVGAAFAIDAVTAMATVLRIPVEIVAITAIALGTSLPELFVSLQAIRMGQKELAVTNILGSNIFNILAVVGVAGLMKELAVGSVVLQLGLPILIAASAIFFINGLGRQIMRWEGAMMLLLFGFFIVKLIAFI